MKLIIIRGVPGTGKTALARKLKIWFSGSELISVDRFKVAAMRKLEDTEKCIKESREISYEKTIDKLEELHEKEVECVIVEEVLDNKRFYKKLRKFAKKKKAEVYWFKLKRKGRGLLETEARRNRIINNSEKDFVRLDKDIRRIKIKKEKVIQNDNLDWAFVEVLRAIN